MDVIRSPSKNLVQRIFFILSSRRHAWITLDSRSFRCISSNLIDTDSPIHLPFSCCSTSHYYVLIEDKAKCAYGSVRSAAGCEIGAVQGRMDLHICRSASMLLWRGWQPSSRTSMKPSLRGIGRRLSQPSCRRIMHSATRLTATGSRSPTEGALRDALR